MGDVVECVCVGKVCGCLDCGGEVGVLSMWVVLKGEGNWGV